MAGFAAVHDPLLGHDLLPVKGRRRTLRPSCNMGICFMTGIAAYIARSPLEIRRMASLARLQLKVQQLERYTVKIR